MRIATTLAAMLFLIGSAWTVRPEAAEILAEAEAFDDYGGWLLDSQFLDQMGSPYLLAHGLGKPVADAKTKIPIDQSGEYKVWVRAKDWVPSHHPGRFQVLINSEPLDVEFGTNGKDWHWQEAGVVRLKRPTATIQLRDLTGFDGRCDAIFFTTEDATPPAVSDATSHAWRKRLLGLPIEPVEAGDFDVVVVGGGIAGCASALSAARLGCRVALVQNRPVLGGNASVEVGISPRGELGGRDSLVAELVRRKPDGDLAAKDVLLSEQNVSLFLEHHANGVVMDGNRIVAVDARDLRQGVDRRFRAPVFIDCTGMAAVGRLAGAETRFGRESRAEFDELLAPEQADRMHHGNTVLFRTRTGDRPVSFPNVPWATAVAKDYADLGGQIERPGKDNQLGPTLGQEASNGLTHFWEYGQWLDPYADAETIRDHLFCAIYGTFSNLKRMAPDRYANLMLDWVGHVPATGEFHRIVGDYILTGNDIWTARQFPDAVARNHAPFCLHYPGHEKYDFRLADWKWIKTPPYQVPFRCLYSRNIVNLMMAGKHMSATHIAGASTKVMLNGGQHGVAVGCAAYLCKKYKATPRTIRGEHIRELQKLVNASVAFKSENAVGVRGVVGCGDRPKRVERLQITKPGVYENFLVDSNWAGGNRVKITADNVTLRNCEIRNATGNGIGVFGHNVTIENCKIHHLLNSTFADQHDAHGITGRWHNVTIRNCEIYYVSGDCIQFDPDRKSTGRVLIENCTLWTGPLPADAAGFKKGERPGENAFDSKTPPTGPRCELTIRNCLMYGWNQPGQIGNMAAINVKENVRATIENCLFRDNEICLRLRGPTGRGDALVTVADCAIFDSQTGVRMEDGLRDLTIRNLAFGAGVQHKYQMVGGPFPGYNNQGETVAKSFEAILRNGWR